MPPAPDAPIRLFVSDVDRTLLTRAHTLPDRVVDAVRRIRDAGTTVVLASARSPFAIAPVAERLGVPPLMIGFNGAWTGRWGEAPEHTRPLPAALAVSLAEAAEADRADVMWFTPDTAHIRRMTERIAGELAVTGEATAEVARWNHDLPPPGKLLVVARDGEHGTAVARAMRADFGHAAQIARSHERLIEITAPGVTKGAAAARLAARLGIAPAEVAAAGDGENDVALLEWAGLALTVENGIAEVRHIADAIGGDCDEGGIADALEAVLARVGA